MRSGDAANGPGRDRPFREASGGTTHGPSTVRQARAARDEYTGDEEAMDLLEKILCRETMQEAYRRVVRNGGAPGVDGMTVHELGDHCREHWPRIRKEILCGTYVPQPVRSVEIPKPSGKGSRMLGIPTVLDRMIQQALHLVLTPMFDPTFSQGSYGYRPGRSTHDAVRQARAHMSAGYRWVVDLDLEKFFDRVQHDVLMSRVARRVKDKRVLRLIRRYLQAGVLHGGIASARTEGTPQGGPLSPLLSNILLDELDRELEQRGHRFVRFADDIRVFVKSERAGTRVLESVERFLAKRLRLVVNREKSGVVRPWECTFLGYGFTNARTVQPKVSAESLKRLRRKLHPILCRGRGRRLDRVIADVSPVLRGWVQYFRLSEVKGGFESLDAWVRRKLRCIVWRQWKEPRTRLQKLQELGVSPAKAAHAAWGRDGPWVSAAGSAINVAVPNRTLQALGLVNLIEEHRRLARSA
jgi:RNA-directed DNA polymerase